MDLDTTTPASTADLLSEIRDGKDLRDALTIREWQAIVAWAETNTIDTLEGAATITDGYLDTGYPIAGPGAPLVSEFGLMELIAVLGRSPDGGRIYVGKIIECAWRLPELYDHVLTGKVETWRALRVAELTHPLSPEAAAYVDHQLAIAVGSVTWALIERLVKEAILRFDPERAEAERQKAADHRHFDIGDMDETGHVIVDGYLDAADGHDLNLAIAREAELLGRLGDDASLDVRRSKAAGAIARRDLALDLLVHDEDTGEVIAEAPGRKIVLNIHITDNAFADEAFVDQAQGSRDGRCATSSTNEDEAFVDQAQRSRDGRCATSSTNGVGRWEDRQTPISVGQIKEWLLARHSTVTMVPVIDVAGCTPADSYEIPDRIRRQAVLRDHTCRFPRCTRPATRCDLDHAVPHSRGGPTCACNVVPLCRRHHRAKTHSDWDYRILTTGLYLWTSPSGYTFLVTPTGTFSLEDPG